MSRMVSTRKIPFSPARLVAGFRWWAGVLLLVTLPLLLCSCSLSAATGTSSIPVVTPFYSYRVVNTYSHDREAFTQGLVFYNGFIYEGTGRYGHSSLRKVELETGFVLKQYNLPLQYFGEGITIFGNRIIQVTWKSTSGFVYDRESFDLLEQFTFPGDCWGLTHDGTRLIMSDGTATLYYLDPVSFEVADIVSVTADGNPLHNLNELEYVGEEIYANIWGTDRIARISPATGRVTGWIDLSGILTSEDRDPPVDVLNGIAYDQDLKRLFVTGKLWPKLFEIELVSPE